ncbi:tRNA adenosine deaminase [Corynebacterium canis]|uniref:tRNA adenosine deaminase n=1 Tax=Corynebacterium canis TaxID=679663 RepID=A0A5C5UF98_9CORY|nr:tRNA adenosine deaminase-associated protein [Corynebacterium canis]TWT24150.1 tRNA adenosine deaminase [Corynebacterium canis]WJY73960.1 hypothetical protein CCANI_00465 [Corynebacterium canis]
MNETEALQEPATDVSFAVTVCRVPSGAWYVVGMDTDFSDIEDTVRKAQAICEHGQVFTMSCVDEDYFVLARHVGDRVELLLSDACMAVNDPYAASVLEKTGGCIPELGECDFADPCPEGNPGLLADLGLSADTMRAICNDNDLLPSAQLLCVAAELGFASEFAQATDLNLD